MKLGKWIGGIMGFMAMGPLGALAGYAIGSLFDKAAYVPEIRALTMGTQHTKDNETAFCFHCWSWHRTSYVPTGKSCTVKWSLYDAFCVPISERMP